MPVPVLSSVPETVTPVKEKPVVAVPKTPGAVWVDPVWSAEVGYRSRSVNDAPRAPERQGSSER